VSILHFACYYTSEKNYPGGHGEKVSRKECKGKPQRAQRGTLSLCGLCVCSLRPLREISVVILIVGLQTALIQEMARNPSANEALVLFSVKKYSFVTILSLTFCPQNILLSYEKDTGSY
jgi:hypothetical protein